jgi:acyl carrier protein
MNGEMEVVVEWLQGLAPRFPGVEITPDLELIEQGLIDSIEILNLVYFLEERFDMVLPIEEFVPENFRTAHTVAAMVSRIQKRGQGGGG